MLTICSVAFSNLEFLQLNIDYSAALNLKKELNWLVVDNSTEQTLITSPHLHANVIPGVEAPVISKGKGSFHHAAALNKALSTVTTRFVLFLDPDFFIVRPNWAKDIVAYMQAHNLAMLGAPWHPRWYRKIRYFPCSHCLLIDLNQIPAESIDFMPDVLNNRQPVYSGYIKGLMTTLEMRGYRRTARWLQRNYERWRRNVEHPTLISSARDTGYYLYKKYGDPLNIRLGLYQPVFEPCLAEMLPADIPHRAFQVSRLLRPLLPDKRSYIPKRRGYFSPIGFRELGYPDIRAQGWEEFLWQGQPFGFHIRSMLNTMPGIDLVKGFLTTMPH